MLLCVILVTCFATFYLLSMRQFNYWKHRNVPFVSPNLFFGNFTINQQMDLTIKNIYDKMKSTYKAHFGIFLFYTPEYVPIDLNLIKRILTIDFNHFTDRGLYMNEKDDPISANLFNLHGEKWRSLRQKLTPIFTSNKLRGTFETILPCVENYINALQSTDGKFVHMKSYTTKLFIDIIGTCALGVTCNSFLETSGEFKRVVNALTSSNFNAFQVTFVSAFKRLSRTLALINKPKSLTQCFLDFTDDILRFRENNCNMRKDFMQTFVELKRRGLFNDDEVAAHVFMFFMASTETSSNTTQNALYEIAKSNCIQNKLRNEITEVLHRHDDKISFDALNEMIYLDQIIKETLRKYPVLGRLNRTCTKEYHIPEHNLSFKVGDGICIPVYALHLDPEYFPQPFVFDPERFNSENRHKIDPYTYLPFGAGLRNCIGLRLGLMQTKLAIVMMVKNFKLKLSDGVPSEMTLDEKSVIITSREKILFDLEKCSEQSHV